MFASICPGFSRMWNEKAFWDWFFPPSKELCYLIVVSVRSEACKGKYELCTHGVATSAGQNPEICLGNSVILSIMKNNQSWNMTQRGFTSEIIDWGWCWLWFCLNYSFEVYVFSLPFSFKTKQNIVLTLTPEQIPGSSTNPFVFRKLQKSCSFFCLQWV